MPRILALEQREGKVWAQLELNPEWQQPVHLLTEEELKRIKCSAIRNFLDQIIDLAAKQ